MDNWNFFEQDLCIKCKKEWRCIASAGKRLCSGCYGEYLANQSIDRLIDSKKLNQKHPLDNKKGLEHDTQIP